MKLLTCVSLAVFVSLLLGCATISDIKARTTAHNNCRATAIYEGLTCEKQGRPATIVRKLKTGKKKNGRWQNHVQARCFNGVYPEWAGELHHEDFPEIQIAEELLLIDYMQRYIDEQKRKNDRERRNHG